MIVHALWIRDGYGEIVTKIECPDYAPILDYLNNNYEDVRGRYFNFEFEREEEQE